MDPSGHSISCSGTHRATDKHCPERTKAEHAFLDTILIKELPYRQTSYYALAPILIAYPYRLFPFFFTFIMGPPFASSEAPPQPPPIDNT